jgi:hypothetical protein
MPANLASSESPKSPQLRAFSCEQGSFPRALFLVLPNNFRLDAQSAQDNHYMQMHAISSPEVALAQSLHFAECLRAAGHTVVLFPGLPDAPDGVFPNNVFATTQSRVIIGAMRHPVRKIEAQRADMRAFFANHLGREVFDLSTQLPAEECAELTGSMVIDRARNIGFCGLSERCTEAGAAAMGAAFGLDQVFPFTLAAGEYHANVVMSALAGKGLMLCREGFADPAQAEQISALYKPAQVIWISPEEKANYVGNCIALASDQLWLSARAEAALRPQTRAGIAALGFALHTAPLAEIEKAGGSLRCMVGEIY